MNHSNHTWDAHLYDSKHSFVSTYGSNILHLLNPRKGEKILDIGCGTGDLTNKIYEHGSKVFGIDQSKNMIAAAKEKYPHLHFSVKDARKLDYDQTFDAVFSNATLHWIKEAKVVLRCIYKSLNREGRFVAEFGGQGNIKSISDELIQHIQKRGFEFHPKDFPWYFPSVNEYRTLMENTGFEVASIQLIDRPTPLNGEDGLKNWIKMFGEQLFKNIPLNQRKQIIQDV